MPETAKPNMQSHITTKNGSSCQAAIGELTKQASSVRIKNFLSPIRRITLGVNSLPIAIKAANTISPIAPCERLLPTPTSR